MNTEQIMALADTYADAERKDYLTGTGEAYFQRTTLEAVVTALVQERDALKERNALFFLDRLEDSELENLAKERDALELSIDQWRVDYHELRIESEALVVAAKLAMDALDALGDSSDRDVAPEIWFTSKADAAFNALKELLK
jgi:hypothetical protein